MSSRRLLACAVLGVLAACGGSSGGGSRGGGGNPLPAAYQGTWNTACVDHRDGTSSIQHLVTGATTYTRTETHYTTATNCTGNSTPSAESGTVSNAGTVTANLGATQVSALQLDVTPSGGATGYMLAYVDTTQSPNRMYMGIKDTPFDGSTPAKRPVALDDSWAFVDQDPELNPLPAAYQGTWVSSCIDNGYGTEIQRVVVGATTYTVSKSSYTTPNCTGDSTPSSESGSLNNAGGVTVSLGATQVTALKVDAIKSDDTEYMLLYVDTTVSPARMYGGLYDAAHDGSTPAKRPVALIQSEYFLKVNSESTPLPAAYQGTWRTPCRNNGDGSSSIQQLVAGATTYTYTETRYATATDCTGISTPSSASGTLNNAGTVTANLGATPVTALQVDTTPNGLPTNYMLAYLDTTVSPNRLYTGLYDAAHDGSTPAKRPVALDASGYFLKVNSELNPLPAAYQGTWRSGCIDNGDGTSSIEQMVTGPTTFSYATARYNTATDCTGPSTPFSGSGTVNSGGTVTASLGATPVTALRVDATESGGATVYTLLYVETAANPNRLYYAIYDAAHDGSTPATRPVALSPEYSLKVNSELNPLPAAYQGTWRTFCFNNGDGTSSITQLVLGATTYTVTNILYTAATNCTGSSSTPYTESGTVSNAGTVTANLGAAPVSAIQVDVTPSGQPTWYGLAYVDTAVEPDRLHMGVSDAGHDGTMPARRPVALNQSEYFLKQ